MIPLEQTVYPNDVPSIFISEEPDEYGGAHEYTFINSLGFEDGKAIYDKSRTNIQFVKKTKIETVPGIQSEQLIIALIDRHKKLNAKYPSAFSDKMIAGLQMFLDACKERVDERMSRGVMGQLKS